MRVSGLERTFEADRGDHGRRLDLVIVRRLAGHDGVSRTRVQAWVDGDRVRVDDRPARRPSQRVLAGQRIRFIADEATVPHVPRVAGEDIPLDVLYEDDHLLAVHKPAGLIVHPSFGHAGGTLMNALMHYARRWSTGRPSLVNRLDKQTSGVLLVARSAAMHARLASAVRQPEAVKEYLALCYGRMRTARRRLRYPIGRDPFDRRRMIVRDDGLDAVTDISRVSASMGTARGLTLVRCRLLTGRTHQIRVHLQADGLPIVGDPVYGDEGWRRVRDASLAAVLRACTRQALHASTLRFMHPVTGRVLTIEAPLPPDLTGLLAAASMSFDAEEGG